MPLVGLVYDDRMCAHEDPSSTKHPESPARISSIWQAVTRAGLHTRCVRLPARKATLEELMTVHSENHVKNICCLSHMPYMESTSDVLRSKHENNSIYFNDKSFEAATLAAGSVVELALKVARGEMNCGAAIVRPPGHHACPNLAMGFCFFNNVAVAARILSGGLVGSQQLIKPQKVLIVDWDVHHGNGTQLVFYNDPNVLYFSVHRYDGGSFYPGSVTADREDLMREEGSVDKVGEGPGEGFNVNVPWPSDGFGDEDYIAVCKSVLMPIGRMYNPDIVLISAGFDAAAGDSIGRCKVTPSGFAAMTRMLKTLAGGKVVLVLEGGYNVEATSQSFVACLRALREDVPEPLASSAPSVTAWEVISKVRQVHAKYWPALRFRGSLYVDVLVRPPPPEWLWYATYGSNMWPARLNCYVQGGKIEGAEKSTPGLRDNTPPAADMWMKFHHRLFFGRNRSNTWGPGGVAFLDPSESEVDTHFRAYKITYDQFNGICAQENSLDPWKQAGPVCPEFVKALRECQYIEYIKNNQLWYRCVLYLGDYDNLPVLTLTCPPSDVEKYIAGTLPLCEPNESYRKVIGNGLTDHPDMNADLIKEYLDRAIYMEPFRPPTTKDLIEAVENLETSTHRKRKNTLERLNR